MIRFRRGTRQLGCVCRGCCPFVWIFFDLTFVLDLACLFFAIFKFYFDSEYFFAKTIFCCEITEPICECENIEANMITIWRQQKKPCNQQTTFSKKQLQNRNKPKKVLSSWSLEINYCFSLTKNNTGISVMICDGFAIVWKICFFQGQKIILFKYNQKQLGFLQYII